MLEGLKVSDLVNAGAALVFMLLSFVVVFKALPIWRENTQMQAEAWKANADSNIELAKALTGLKENQINNFEQCNDFQRMQKSDLTSLENRLSAKLDEIKGVAVLTLRNSEETNAWHKATAKQ